MFAFAFACLYAVLDVDGDAGGGAILRMKRGFDFRDVV